MILPYAEFPQKIRFSIRPI